MPDITPDERARIHEDAEQMGYNAGFAAGRHAAGLAAAAYVLAVFFGAFAGSILTGVFLAILIR